MARLLTALLAGLLISVGLVACGGGDSDVADVIPKSTPDLVAPRTTSLPPATVGTTSTAISTTTPTTVTPTVTPSTGAGTSTGGGTSAGGGTSSGAGTSTGTSGGGTGGFSNFCTQNPGACGQ